jgi:diguanylate cyclase (GGDEF)-like protein
MADHRKILPEGAAAPAEENALLRASITDLQARLTQFEPGMGTDGLTGLPNRQRLIGELARATASAERYDTPAALLCLEVEGLEAFGERQGPLAADTAIVRIARLISGLIRSTDVAARVAENRFALILDHLDHNSAIETSERIARCIAAAEAEGAQLRVWIGVAAILKGDSEEEVLERAELNLRRMKEDA